MAADEIVKLKVTTEGDQAALQSLTKIDQLIAKINGQKVNISFAQGMKEAEAAAQRSAEAINANTAAEARAIEAKTKLVNAESRLAVAHERTIQAQERTKQATERTAQAVAKKAAEEAKAAAQTSRLAQAQERTAQAEISRNTAEIQGFTARTRLAQSENTLAAAQERTAQAVERTKQVIAAQTTEEIKAAAAKTKLAQAEVNLASAKERSYQASQKTAQEEEKTAQAREKTLQTQNRLTLEEMRQQERQQQRLRQGYRDLGRLILRALTKNISQATDELKAMNAEMVSIQKVTGATDADMERLKNSAFEVAGALGSTPSDYLSSVTKWAQAGYKGLSEQLGELSAKTQVVGDVNEETANKFLLAVDAAYKYKGNIDALTRVLDGANEISNNYATSVEKLAGGMGIVSSLAEQAGMKVEETMAAIGTITAKTQESGNSAARALRALILNIQGSTEIEIDAETGERWTEDEIQRTAAALGDLNVATREYKNGIMELRNPMKVIGELAEKYQKGLVTEAQLQEVVASLGGKVRSNQLMALIQGYETYTNMIETYKDAVGSADQELEIYLNGWEAKSNRLVAQWTQFIETFKATDISTGILDFGNAILEFANSGGIPTLASQVLTLTAAITGLNMVLAGSNIAKSAGIFIAGIGAAAAGATGPVTGLLAALKAMVGIPGLIALGAVAAIGVLDHFIVTAEEQAQAAADAAAEYEKEKAVLEGLEDQLKTTGERIDELNGKDSLTVVEQEELDKLEEENRRLERQIILQKDLAEAKKRTAEAETNNSLNKGYTGANYYNFQPWSENLPLDTSVTKESVENALGWRKGFEEQANYLMGLLDQLEEKKKQFLADHGDQKGWTTQTVKDFESIEGEIQNARDVSAAFYNELDGLIQNLPEGANKELWEGIQDALWGAMYPAEALTEKFNRLVDAMDEAEKNRFDEALKRVQADGKVTAQEVQTLIDLFPVLKPLLEGNAGALDTLAQYLTEATAKTEENTAATKENQNAQKEAADGWDQVASKLKKYTNQAGEVKDAQEELRKTGTLSFDTLVGLLGKYGNAVNDVVMKAIDGKATQEEIFKALEIAYASDVENYRNAILEKEMNNEDFYSSWLAGNADTVKALLAQYGINAGNYKTFAQLKEAIENGTQKNLTSIEQSGANDRKAIFQRVADAFANSQDAMLAKAQSTNGAISALYGALAGIMRGVSNAVSGTVSSTVSNMMGPVKDTVDQLRQKQQDEAWQKIMDTLAKPVYPGGSSSGSKGSSSSGKNWYETQIDNLKTLEEQTKRTNQVLEKSDQDTAQKRIDNLKKVQEQILAAQKQFIAKGKAETSDEVNQLKIMYQGLGDDVKDIYAGMSDALLEQHKRLEWEFDQKGNEPRTMDQIAADDANTIEHYRKMQQELHDLAEYYRSQDLRGNDDLIRELQDKWWEYENAIRDMYSNLTDAFNDYIDESSHKIEELGRATGNAGKQIELYAQRIRKAQETMAALQKNNINGALNGQIFDLESQIWGDKDAIRDLQEGLWDELEDAFDDIFDRVQDDIDSIGDEISAIQDQMDGINDILEQYDKELEGILKPINNTLEKLNDQLEAERKRLEALTAPLNERKDALEDQIKGYYTINPDGSIGPYIKGLDDSIDEIQDQIDKANEELDRVNDAWNEQKDREEEALALQKKQLAVEEAQKAVEEAMLALQTARNERNVYTLKDGVWAWRADEEAVAKAEKALADAEKAKEEAEKELQDYKEEQAHKQIVKRLEEQIRALEEQKKLLDKQKDLINKQIEALNKQISAYEKESAARQDYIQNLIDQKEEEKKAWEDHYQALKEQYNDQLSALEQEKKLAEERKKQAEQQYEDWMDTWKDIQKSIETPARELSEILNDIAKYGTPAMADQVDRVTDLLRDLGYAIKDVTGGGGYDPDQDGGDMSRQDVIDRMWANMEAWHQTSDPAERARLEAENQRLGASIGAHYDPASGTWDVLTGIPQQEEPIRPLRAYSLEELENDEWAQRRARGEVMSTSDFSNQQSYRPFSSPGPQTVSYTDSHAVTFNGVTIGTNMLQRPLSDTLRLVGLNMGN